MLLKHSEPIKKWFSFPKKLKYESKWIIMFIIFLAPILIFVSYFNPIFGKKLHHSTQWLGNISPLLIVVAGYFLKEEITNWRYKTRAEAASEIIGKFRVCSKDLTYWVNAGGVTPATGEEAAGRKIHLSINKYVESCLKPSAQFPIPTRKELDNHFNKMRVLANKISGNLTIITSPEPNKTFGPEITMKACANLQSLNSKLEEIQDFLDQKLGQYLER
jgi:hypothetical protein